MLSLPRIREQDAMIGALIMDAKRIESIQVPLHPTAAKDAGNE
jgi:hypothetical protein